MQEKNETLFIKDEIKLTWISPRYILIQIYLKPVLTAEIHDFPTITIILTLIRICRVRADPATH